MQYISAHQAADKWNISKRRVQTLCAEGRIEDSVRIGNMWVVPVNASKPMDARKKNTSKGAVNTEKLNTPMKSARIAIKSITAEVFDKTNKYSKSTYEAKIHTLAMFSAEIIVFVFSSYRNVDSVNNLRVEILKEVYNLFNFKVSLPQDVMDESFPIIHNYLLNNSFCIDDTLSWVYQFVNKISKDTDLDTTQFFTEKYMISALLDQADLSSEFGKILDPACGGGNFLINALELLCNNAQSRGETLTLDLLQDILNQLFGYELDSSLAVIANINLRIKALEILSIADILISMSDFMKLSPKIFCSKNNNVIGAIDIEPKMHIVTQIGCAETYSLFDVLCNASYIFTNPPFRTVKGMSEQLRQYLRKYYKDARCDLCNAFILMCLQNVEENGFCGLVTQNSWLYLDSFVDLRKRLFSQYSLNSIIELGTNAFYDLGGEKTNIVLLYSQKYKPTARARIATYNLKQLPLSKLEKTVASRKMLVNYENNIPQLEILNNPRSRFDTISSNYIKEIQLKMPSYDNFATAMQGTSTGDSKQLVGYFWDHLDDKDWLLVSKGGGYSRWQGLNKFVVKWGEAGEFIKATKGSAIRNDKYFSATQMVFSDTGTAGLNVRTLSENQIFIASGPGIRIHQGNKMAHLALLNSRLMAYYIRLSSPKLTIAAGYIAQLPIEDSLLNSVALSNYAQECISAKKRRLARVPSNFEFNYAETKTKNETLVQSAIKWFLQDVEESFIQLTAEYEIDKTITTAYKLSIIDLKNINDQIGCHPMQLASTTDIVISELDKKINALLNSSLELNRTKPSKNALGCDSFLEYIAVSEQLSPEYLKNFIFKNINELELTIKKYKAVYLHSTIMYVLGYTTSSKKHMKTRSIEYVLEELYLINPKLRDDTIEIEHWICNCFNEFHTEAFLDSPIIYLANNTAFELLGG